MSREIPPSKQRQDDARRFYRVVEIYVDECGRRRTEVRASELADRIGLTREHVSAEFRRAGLTLKNALMEEQARRAAHLLLATPLTTSEIARATGFGTLNTFYRVFRKVFGVPPVEFRRRRLKK